MHFFTVTFDTSDFRAGFIGWRGRYYNPLPTTNNFSRQIWNLRSKSEIREKFDDFFFVGKFKISVDNLRVKTPIPTLKSNHKYNISKINKIPVPKYDDSYRCLMFKMLIDDEKQIAFFVEEHTSREKFNFMYLTPMQMFIVIFESYQTFGRGNK